MHTVLRPLALGFLLVAAAAGCSLERPRERWDSLSAAFLEAYFKANPTFAVYQGRHEYDGRLPDLTDAGIRADIAALHRWRDSAAAFDTAGLDAPRRFEREYLLAQIDKDLFWTEAAEQPWKNPTWYGGILDPNVYVTRPYAPLPDRLRAFNTWAAAVPGALDEMRKNLRTPLPKSYVAIGRLQMGGMASYLEHDVPTVFDSVADTTLQRQFKDVTAMAVKALADADAWFAGQEKMATDDFPLGADLFGKMVKETEGVEVSLDRLETRPARSSRRAGRSRAASTWPTPRSRKAGRSKMPAASWGCCSSSSATRTW
jgi:hypothetical protein